MLEGLGGEDGQVLQPVPHIDAVLLQAAPQSAKGHLRCVPRVACSEVGWIAAILVALDSLHMTATSQAWSEGAHCGVPGQCSALQGSGSQFSVADVVWHQHQPSAIMSHHQLRSATAGPTRTRWQNEPSPARGWLDAPLQARKAVLRSTKVLRAHLHELAYLMATGQVVQDHEGQDVQRHGRELSQPLYDGWDLVGVRLHLQASLTLGVSRGARCNSSMQHEAVQACFWFCCGGLPGS